MRTGLFSGTVPVTFVKKVMAFRGRMKRWEICLLAEQGGHSSVDLIGCLIVGWCLVGLAS